MIKSTFRSMSLPAGRWQKSPPVLRLPGRTCFFWILKATNIPSGYLTWNISFYGWFNYWNIIKGWFSNIFHSYAKLSDGTNRVVSDFDEILMVCLRDFMGNERDERDYLQWRGLSKPTHNWGVATLCWKQQEINPCINPRKWGKTFVYLLELMVSCRVSFYQVFVQLWEATKRSSPEKRSLTNKTCNLIYCNYINIIQPTNNNGFQLQYRRFATKDLQNSSRKNEDVTSEPKELAMVCFDLARMIPTHRWNFPETGVPGVPLSLIHLIGFSTTIRHSGVPLFEETSRSLFQSICLEPAELTKVQWEFQDPNMEVLYHIRPYFEGIFPEI